MSLDRNSPWGIVFQPINEWDVSQVHQGGVAFLRINFWWNVVQPLQPLNRSQFQWLTLDRLVRWATDRGMWIFASLGGTPAWAVDPARIAADNNQYRPSAYPPADLTLWDNYVTQVVMHYASRVHYWGIWNEPDSFSESANVCFWRGTQKEFFDNIVGRAVPIIRTVADANICVPEIAHSGVTTWINDLLNRFGASLHAVTIHDYHGGGTGIDVINGAMIAKGAVDAYNAAHGTHVGLWITETGWKNTEHTEADIGARLQNLCSAVRGATWVKKVFPYVWSDDFGDEFSFKASARVIRQQWSGYRTGINAPQQAVALERDSLVVSHNVPAAMTPGRTYDVQMTFKNVGRWTWPQQGTIRLGFGSHSTPLVPSFVEKVDISDARLQQVVQSISGVTAPSRVLIADAAVPAGGQTTFSFKVTAPAQAGHYLIGWCLVDDNSADRMFFGQGLLERLSVQ